MPDGHLVAVPMDLLRLIGQLWADEDTDKLSLGTVRLLLQLVRVDQVSGQAVFRVEISRDLGS